MPKWDTHRIYLKVDGFRLKEYPDVDGSEPVRQPDGDLHITRWIASESGKVFVIYFRDKNVEDRDAASYDVEIDGEWAGNIHTRASYGDISDSGPVRESLHGTLDESGCMRRLMWADIEFTDTDSLTRAPSMNHRVGEIVIQIMPIHVTGMHVDESHWQSEILRSEITPKIFREEKKAIVRPHCVALGPVFKPAPGESEEVLEFEYLENEPRILVIYKYAPLEYLRSHGIAPPMEDAPGTPVKVEDVPGVLGQTSQSISRSIEDTNPIEVAQYTTTQSSTSAPLPTTPISEQHLQNDHVKTGHATDTAEHTPQLAVNASTVFADRAKSPSEARVKTEDVDDQQTVHPELLKTEVKEEGMDGDEQIYQLQNIDDMAREKKERIELIQRLETEALQDEKTADRAARRAQEKRVQLERLRAGSSASRAHLLEHDSDELGNIKLLPALSIPARRKRVSRPRRDSKECEDTPAGKRLKRLPSMGVKPKTECNSATSTLQSLRQAQGVEPALAPEIAPLASTLEPRADSSDVEVKDEEESGDDGEIHRLEERLSVLRKRKRPANIKVKSEPGIRRPCLSGPSDVIDLTLG